MDFVAREIEGFEFGQFCKGWRNRSDAISQSGFETGNSINQFPPSFAKLAKLTILNLSKRTKSMEGMFPKKLQKLKNLKLSDNPRYNPKSGEKRNTLPIFYRLSHLTKDTNMSLTRQMLPLNSIQKPSKMGKGKAREAVDQAAQRTIEAAQNVIQSSLRDIKSLLSR